MAVRKLLSTVISKGKEVDLTQDWPERAVFPGEKVIVPYPVAVPDATPCVASTGTLLFVLPVLYSLLVFYSPSYLNSPLTDCSSVRLLTPAHTAFSCSLTLLSHSVFSLSTLFALWFLVWVLCSLFYCLLFYFFFFSLSLLHSLLLVCVPPRTSSSPLPVALCLFHCAAFTRIFPHSIHARALLAVSSALPSLSQRVCQLGM